MLEFSVAGCSSGWPPCPLVQVCSLEKTSHKMPAPFCGTRKALVLLVTSLESGCHSGLSIPVPPSLSTNMLPHCWGKSLEHC